ncbi:enoyl-CoA hydratase/isomerase family protein [Intestinimonas timonensis]|uniref:enoyl-CoA hydratase/isomerase family protein n=1 Tax=Intestinimonas timonensis TaxID=1689270 RepID=UPI003A8DE100
METLLYREENHVGYITLNIPDKLNALRGEMKDELVDLLRKLRGDSNVRALVITGAGRSFCAGGDVSTMGDKQKNNEGRDRMRLCCDWCRELMRLEKPVIAAVNGYAFGAGLTVALLCDFIVASEKASFQCSFVNIGLVPDSGCTWLLPKRVGMGKAREMMYTGRTVKTEEALQIGLADQVVAPDDLMATATELAERLAQGPTYTIGLTKSLLNKTYESSFSDYLDMEANYQASAFQTVDHTMAVKAFLEKTDKHFTGL